MSNIFYKTKLFETNSYNDQINDHINGININPYLKIRISYWCYVHYPNVRYYQFKLEFIKNPDLSDYLFQICKKTIDYRIHSLIPIILSYFY